MRLLFALQTVMLVVFAAAPACADLISAIEVQSIAFTGTQNNNTASDGVAGWAFTAVDSFSISALGYYDHLQDGFVDPHEIGLWRINGATSTLVATTELSAGTAAVLMGDFRYGSITPLEITAGNDYVIGATIGFGSGTAQYDPTVTPSSSGWTSTSHITNVVGRFGLIFPAGSGFNNSNFPSDFGTPSDPPFLGPNFLITSVPEPSSFALLSSCISCLALSHWRPRKITK
ncbi:MAG: hypothetical protein R3C53_21640 [Pirellulaceae bacterium]